MRVRQARRKRPLRWLSCGVGGVRNSAPDSISSKHSRHFPCLMQEVGTVMPSDSAKSNRVVSAPIVPVFPSTLTVEDFTAEIAEEEPEFIFFSAFSAVKSSRSGLNPRGTIGCLNFSGETLEKLHRTCGIGSVTIRAYILCISSTDRSSTNANLDMIHACFFELLNDRAHVNHGCCQKSAHSNDLRVML